jgi:fibronectin-binding autotransporter adhesin
LSGRHLRRTVVVVVICAAAFFGWAQVARADTTITVNTTADAVPSDTECSGVAGDCSLRQAIDFANRDVDSTDTIDVPAGTYTLTEASSSCDGQFDYCGPLGVGTDVTIIGEGTASVVITADYPAFDSRLMVAQGDATNVDIESVTFAGGYGEDQSGGALMVESAAEASLEDVAFSDNTAAGGGALAVESYGSLTATDVTFDGNQSTNGDGGAILVNNSASVELDQATVVNNGGGTDVGAIENDGGTVTLYSVTMNGNAGSDLDTLGSTNIQNSIIADGCSGDDDPNSQGNNIFPSDTCPLETADGDIPDGVPGLSALADNGGPTETEALLSTSDAIGNGSDCDDEDQRHIDRDGTCDIGAYAAGVQFSGTSGTALTASFSDTEETCPPSATIDWGDGSAVDDATVSCGPSSDDIVPVTITGTHTYAAAGYYHLVAAEPSFGVSIAGSATIGQGSTIVVNTTADTAPFERECSGQDGDCSLREAIDYASNGDTIELPAGTYTLTLPSDDCNFNYCGALGIDENVTIVGEGATSADVVVTADYPTFDDRLMDVEGDATSADLQNLTLAGGNAGEESGGALLAEYDAEVSLEDVTFSGNTAYGGGALAATSESSVSGDGVTFDGNMTTSGDGAAIVLQGGDVSLENATIVNNGSDDDVGAVEDDDGSLTLTSVTMNGNAGSDLDIGDAYASIENSIIADGCSGDNANSSGANIFPTDTCHIEATDGDIPDGVPGLAALADNGGPTETEALLSTSDAIGNGSDCENGDQRHALRGNTCDIGAYASGIQFSGTAATTFTANFTDSTSVSCPSSATIDWGDGAPSTAATVSCAPRSGDFIPVTITGTHTYSAAGYYNLLATLDSGDSIAGAATIAPASSSSPPPPPPAKQSAPTVGGIAFTGIGATAVIVNGSANPNGSPTSYVVNYGTTTSYGQQAGAVSIGSGTGTVALSRQLSGLLPGTTYHVEIVATNSGGSTASADATFTTAAATATLPPPVPGQTFDVLPFSGTVLINGQPLVAGEQIPFGSIIDATKGTVTLQVVGPNGDIQTASFFGAVFQVTQTATGGIQLALTGGDFSVCKVKKTRKTAAVDAKPKPGPKGKSKPSLSTLPNTKVVRSLWGNGHGSFTTKGRYAAATVRGTVWRTSDRCDGTNITVAEGIISVLDLVTNKTVIVHAPHQFLATP